MSGFSYNFSVPNMNVNINSSNSFDKKGANNKTEDNPVRIPYSDKWVVMQNALVYSISDLSLEERRMILYLSPIVRKEVEKNPNQQVFTIKIADYAKEYNIKNKDIYAYVKKFSKSLKKKSFVLWAFEDNHKYEQDIQWAYQADYKDYEGRVDIHLPPKVIEMLTVFDQKNIYTKYEKRLLINLNSHALILLELIASFESQRNRQKEFTIEYLREKFGCTENYKKISDFNRYVLYKSSKDLAENTHYIVDFDFQAKSGGRKITHVVIKVKYKVNEKMKEKIRTGDEEHGLAKLEYEIVIEQAEKYIEKRGVTDKQHKRNIIKKAIRERWGLDDQQGKQETENEKHQQRLEQERQKEEQKQKEEQAQKEQAQKELLECEEKFLSMNEAMQNVILDSIENGLEGSFRKAFAEERKTNKKIYADVMYSAKFKELMKNIG